MSAGATALIAAVITLGGAAPAHAYDYTKMVQGKTKAACLGQITGAAMKPPAGMKFAHHSGCSYNSSLRYWIAAVSFDRR